MPLKTLTSDPQSLADLLAATAAPTSPSFLVVYASVSPSTGKSWCGDCRAAEPFVEKYLGSLDREVGVVYAGQPAEWRTPTNPYHQAPFLVEKLPTVIKVGSDGKWGRLVEGDVYDESKIRDFVSVEAEKGENVRNSKI